jgi:subtilisin family serine protease
MVFATTITVFLSAIASVSALSPPLPGVSGFAGSVNNLENGPLKTVEPLSKFILQFRTEGLSKRDADPHSAFHKRAQESGLSYTTRQTYSNEGTFVALSLSLENGTIDDLKNLENVANVWPVQKIGRPTAVMQTWPGKSNLQGEIRRRETTDENVTFSLPYITGDIKPNNPHTMAGVDKAQALGYFGAGVKIAAIDTGVDYYHPSLGGCFGEGCKISFGYDFVGDDYPTTTVEGPTPLAQCLLGGHGTHVMGELFSRSSVCSPNMST